MLTTCALLLAIATVAQAGGSSNAPPCPFARTSNPPLADYPPVINFNDVTNQNLETSLWGNELLISTFGALYRSTDAGKTFTTLRNAGDNYWGAMKTSTGVYLTSTPNGLFRSTDNGRTFTNLNLLAPAGTYPLQSYAKNMFAEVGSQIIWGTQNGFYVSDDQGATFKPIPCASLITLANPPNQTISDCEYLFTSAMTVTPDKTKVLATFSALGLSGVYSLRVPVPKAADGTYQPVYETVYFPPVCGRIEFDGSVCPSSGPITVFKDKVYVGSNGNLLAINSVTQADVVLSSGTVDTDMAGLAVSPDSSVIAASWGGSIFSSKTGAAGSWVAPNRSGCSNPNLVFTKPTNPQGDFKRGISPVSSTGGPVFAVGTIRGPYLWTVAYATFTASDRVLSQATTIRNASNNSAGADAESSSPSPSDTTTPTYAKVLQTASAGATAGLVLAMTTVLTHTHPNRRLIHLFPDFPAEFVPNLPREANAFQGTARYLARGTVSHAALFTLYHGLTNDALRDRKDRSQTAAGKAEVAAIRFFAGGIGSLGYRAAASSLIKAEVERLTLTPAQNFRFLGMSFALAGLVLAVGDGLKDEIVAWAERKAS
ncbi:hypothetical protein HDU96_007264 [Phlyctochytrium bullatum]|nr:hypothetical protein HDU96_007264 [Phlyctochytrium bullatum]